MNLGGQREYGLVTTTVSTTTNIPKHRLLFTKPLTCPFTSPMLLYMFSAYFAAAAESLQSCLTLSDPMDCPASREEKAARREGTGGCKGRGRGQRQKRRATRNLRPGRWKRLESQAQRPEAGGGGSEGPRANEGRRSSEQSSGHRKWKRRSGCVKE